MTSTINQWSPGKEKVIANGAYFATIFVPGIAVWISTTYGWRTVFNVFAIPEEDLPGEEIYLIK